MEAIYKLLDCTVDVHGSSSCNKTRQIPRGYIGDNRKHYSTQLHLQRLPLVLVAICNAHTVGITHHKIRELATWNKTLDCTGCCICGKMRSLQHGKTYRRSGKSHAQEYHRSLRALFHVLCRHSVCTRLVHGAHHNIHKAMALELFCSTPHAHQHISYVYSHSGSAVLRAHCTWSIDTHRPHIHTVDSSHLFMH